ncbi:unnamed protein product [Gongylonema pulchrum]|uniref:ANF_receptor domain-containing protein n=1 Tax=Gongylonema pulchrum TaxID=637853 RepID=A0A183DST9_9BILA|nr:unnamed protein product [Gongylonema pulchrum]
MLQADGTNGFMLPKAFLNSPAIAVMVITISATSLNDYLKLFSGSAEVNKELFEEIFKWKNKDRIKGAIILSRQTSGDCVIDETAAFRNAQKMSRLLGSLPEAQEMTICAVTDFHDHDCIATNRTAKNESKITVLLFGGAVRAHAYYCPTTMAMQDFWKWKTEQDQLREVCQTIGFYISTINFPILYAYYSEAMGSKVPLAEMIGHGRISVLHGVNNSGVELQRNACYGQHCIFTVGFEKHP